MGLNGVLLYFSSSIDGFVETRKGKKKKKKKKKVCWTIIGLIYICMRI